MTQGDQLLVLNRADLVGLDLSWDEIIDVLTDAYAQKAAGQVQNPPKPKVVSREESFFNAMPAYLGGSDRVGIKWVSGFETNKRRGLPYIYGSMIVNDAATGRPLALLDGGWITEVRTPGVSGVSMRLFDRTPRRLAVLGAGVQGRGHLDVALAVHPGIEEVTVFDSSPETSARVLEQAGDRRTRVAQTAQDAVTGADLVITCLTRRMDPQLDCADADPDAFLLPVDYDDAIGAGAINTASFYAVDDPEQYRTIRTRGHYFQDLVDPPHELAEVVAGDVTPPTTGRRVYLNMGIAMADVALAGLCLDRAREAGVGTAVTFP